MQCKWYKCSNESRTRSEFCSEKCKKQYARNRDKVGQTDELSGTESQVGQITGTELTGTDEVG